MSSDGNVAQVFVEDEDFCAALRNVRCAVRPGGRVVFEVRDPSRQAWLSWNREDSHRRTEITGVGMVESWVDLLDVSLPFVAFRWTYQFEGSGDVVTSDSTLRFRSPRKSSVASIAAVSSSMPSAMLQIDQGWSSSSCAVAERTESAPMRLTPRART